MTAPKKELYRRRKQTPESALLSLCMDYLAAEHVLAFRMNTGAIKTENRFIRFGTPGMADILAFASEEVSVPSMDDMQNGRKVKFPMPIWLELKAHKGVQTELQKSFQKQVEAEGHVYLLVRSLDDLKAALA